MRGTFPMLEVVVAESFLAGMVGWVRVRRRLLDEARTALGEEPLVVLRRGTAVRLAAAVLLTLGTASAVIVVSDSAFEDVAAYLVTPALVLGTCLLLLDLLLEHQCPPGVAIGRRGVWLGGNESSRGPAEVVPWSEVAALTYGTADAYGTTRLVVAGHVVWGGTRNPPLDVGVRLHDPRPRTAELAEVLEHVGASVGRSVVHDADGAGLGTRLRTRPVARSRRKVSRRLAKAASMLAPHIGVEPFGDVRLRSEAELVAQVGREVTALFRGGRPGA